MKQLNCGPRWQQIVGRFVLSLDYLDNLEFFKLNVDQHKVSFHIAVQSETHNL